MIEIVQNILVLIHTPTMLLCAVLHVIFGALGLGAPGTFRRAVQVFTRDRTVRLLGIPLMIIGAEMFLGAGAIAWPLLAKVLGVILFVDGGVKLFIPTLTVMATEWAAARSNWWHRGFGIICLALAYVYYYLATNKMPIIE